MTAYSGNCHIPMIIRQSGSLNTVLTLFRTPMGVSVMGDVNGGHDAPCGASFGASADKDRRYIDVQGGQRTGEDYQRFSSTLAEANRLVEDLSQQIWQYQNSHGSLPAVLERMAPAGEYLESFDDLIIAIGLRPFGMDRDYLRTSLGVLARAMDAYMDDRSKILHGLTDSVWGRWQYEIVTDALADLGVSGTETEVADAFVNLKFAA